MSLKRKPTVIKFSQEEEKQKFYNWAVGPSEPSKGINKARDAMRLAQRNNQFRSKRINRGSFGKKVEIELPENLLTKISSSPLGLRTIKKQKYIVKSYLKIKKKRDGE
ncbi:hypothetical protein [Sutcliffiella horikoshii]|uniref:hypothetical protein n=1 Tax=Sutcliffiella horikoshii TaxID=79883 RepID=UPI001CFDE5D5|nr:hypothetical protein [Sutcliffiella horikoshii]